jgi:hypothetical protein
VGHYIDIGSARQLLANSKRLGGHFEERHTKITNEEMMQRLYNGEGAQNGQVQWISSFLTLNDAALAAVEVLRTWGDDRYNAMINNRIQNDTISANTLTPFRARFAFGSGVHTLPTHAARIVLRPTPEGLRYRVHTFFPLPPFEGYN